jgi:hypothetical protein
VAADLHIWKVKGEVGPHKSRLLVGKESPFMGRIPTNKGFCIPIRIRVIYVWFNNSILKNVTSI